MCCRLFPLWSKIDAVVRGPAKVNKNEKDEGTKSKEAERERWRRIEKAKNGSMNGICALYRIW